MISQMKNSVSSVFFFSLIRHSYSFPLWTPHTNNSSGDISKLSAFFWKRQQTTFCFIPAPRERVLEKAVPVWWCAQRPRFSPSWSWRTWDSGSRLWICCRARSYWPLLRTRKKFGHMSSLVSHKSGSVERINRYVLFVMQRLYVAEQETAIMNTK